MYPPRSSVPTISSKDKGNAVAEISKSPVIEVPEKWSDIKCIRECLWVNEGVLNVPSNVKANEDLKIIEDDWKKCFHLYLLQTGTGKKATKVKNANP
jgi:hypothetical protein